MVGGGRGERNWVVREVLQGSRCRERVRAAQARRGGPAPGPRSGDPDYHLPAVPLAVQALVGVQSRLTVEPVVALRSFVYVYTVPDLLVAVRM